ncbi:MAG: divalent-cation tolerance protein CutA, partial [Caulobacterales bacterium]
MQKNPDGVLLYTTWPGKDVAEACARTLVSERLAACANILGGALSIYRWQDTIEQAEEIVMVVKTTRQTAPECVARIAALHPYDVPVIADVALGQASGEEFLQWLNESVK